MKRQYYLLRIEGDVDPIVTGPYVTDATRLDHAREVRAKYGDQDGIFRLDAFTGHRAPEVTPFLGKEFPDA